MAITATFLPAADLLMELGDNGNNSIVTSRDATGRIC